MTARDIDILYGKCMTQLTKDRISARTIYNYCISPFMVHCDKFAPENKKDPLTLYDKLLLDQGKEHESRVIEKVYPEAEKLAYTTREEGFRTLLGEMQKGAAGLCGSPAFYLPEGLEGVFDVIERRDTHPSIFGNYHYVVKEIKLAKNIQDHHIYQAAFYNCLLGKIQGYTPMTFYVINRDLDEIGFSYDEEKVAQILEDIREIMEGKDVSPTLRACLWPWESYNDEEAKKRRDISLASGIGPAFKRKLHSAGIFTIDDLAKVSMKNLLDIKGIGEKTASKFSLSARALISQKHIPIAKCEIPEKPVEIFLDLEGTGEQVRDEELVAIDYLIGVLVRKDGNQEYKAFLAEDLEKEGDMLRDFVEWLRNQRDFIIYHWHHYESTHLRKLAERHGLSEAERNLILENMRDLYKDAVSSFAFPTYGNGLKEIAAYMGHKWRHPNVDALESIAFYFLYVQDPKKHKDKIQKVIDYNEDDCRATMVIKDWLSSESKKQTKK